jgi:hypothetical protein
MQLVNFLESLKDQLGAPVIIILGDDSFIKPKTIPEHHPGSVVATPRPHEEGTIR